MVRNVRGISVPPKWFIHEEKDLFLSVNCRPILAHPVPLLPLVQLRKIILFPGIQFQGHGAQAGDLERAPRTALSEWKQDDFCSKQFPQHPPFPPTMDPMLKGRQGHVEVTEHQHMQDIFFTLEIQQKKRRANQLTLFLSHPS